MSIEAMKQALEALEYPLNTSPEGFDVDMAELLAHRAITSLRQAIAEAEKQEPVTMHEDWYDSNSCGHCGMVGGHLKTCRQYTSPQIQPLTDEQIREVILKMDPENHYLPKALRQFCRLIEAAHGIGDKS
jgi:hypothetical protein